MYFGGGGCGPSLFLIQNVMVLEILVGLPGGSLGKLVMVELDWRGSLKWDGKAFETI